MFSNDIIPNNCDNITTSSINMEAGDGNISTQCRTTKSAQKKKNIDEITQDLRQKQTNISSMNCDQDENNSEKEKLQQDEEDEEIYYESTNESENYEEENRKVNDDAESGVNDCSLTKLYLDDIVIDSNEEEQTITELANGTENDKLIRVEQNKGMHVAFGVLLKILFPLANGVVQGIKGIRDVRFLRVLRSIASSRQALTNLFAFAANTISMNLSSVQVSHRIEPILNLLKIRKSRDGIESLPDSTNGTEALSPPLSPLSTATIFSPFSRQSRYSLPNLPQNRKKVSSEEYMATKFCTMNVLAEPKAGEPIRADIIFIHGLHGSLVNTWKQGLWENERRPVEFQRPPKPPVRPPKRPRHSRTTTLHPPHHQKRARFCQADDHQKHSNEKDSLDEGDENPYTFVCGEAKDIQVCDGIEYSFPTFRLRMNDNGRLFHPEHDCNLYERKKIATDTEEECQKISDNSCDKTEKRTKGKPAKPSSDDPNYSKCWPGDWLPLDCPGVRVIAINYTTDPHLWRPLWKKKEPRSNLIERSREMADLLIKQRVGYGHPIIWVGHSKGGLFIKQMIVDAWESGRPAVAPFWRSARGVFFYSVPHRGSHLASIKAPLLLRSVELIDIEKNNKYLLDLHRRFAGLYHLGHLKIEVFSFVETALTLMSVLFMRIVGVDSADPGIGDVCGIRLDHREICKPRNRDCILYKQLVNMINKVC